MRQAQLPDGTTLEFPDETPDSVIDLTVKKHLGITATQGAKIPKQPKMSAVAPSPQPAVQAPQPASDQVELGMPYPEEIEKFRPGLFPGEARLYHTVTKSVIGGGLRLARGALPIGFDIVAAFGSKDAEKIASNIRKNIPQLHASTTAENIGMTFAQYALPTGTALKLGGALLKGMPWAIRFAGGLVAGGLGDFIGANPEESTMADVIPGLKYVSPTETKPGESVISKKRKIATEAVYMGGTFSAVSGTLGIGKKIAGYIISPGKYVRKAVAAALQNQALDVPKALTEIDQSLLKRTAGFEPTTGTASGDLGLIGMEKATAHEPEMAARKELNFASISDELQSVTERMGGDPHRAKQFFEDYIDAAIEGKRVPLEAAEAGHQAIEDEMVDMVHNFSLGRGKQAEASLALDDILRQELESLTAKKNELFRAIDPGNQVVIEKGRIREAFKDMMTPRSEMDSTVSEIPKPIINRVLKYLRKPAKGQEELQLTFGALQDLRPALSRAIAFARKNDLSVERLTDFKKVVERETEVLAASQHPAAERAKDALAFYKNEFVPRFKQGIGKAFRMAIRTDRPWPGSATAGQFLYRPTGAGEAAEQLQKIATGPEAEGAIREYLIDTVADKMTNVKTGRVALDRLTQFMNQRPVRETLAKYPAVRTELNQLVDSIKTRKQAQSVLEGQILLRKNELLRTQKEMAKSATKFYVDRDPVHAVGSALRSQNPTRGVQELVTLARRDTSGEALQGLRKSLGDYIETNVRGTTEIGGELEILRGKMVRLMKNPETRKAISHLYNPSEMRVLDDVLDKLQLMNRVNKQVLAGAATAERLAGQVQKARVVLASLYGIVKGRGVFAISSWLAKTFNRDPVELSKALLKDAMLDPDLAKTLLMMDTKTSERIVRMRLGAHIMNNILPNLGAQ